MLARMAPLLSLRAKSSVSALVKWPVMRTEPPMIFSRQDRVLTILRSRTMAISRCSSAAMPERVAKSSAPFLFRV